MSLAQEPDAYFSFGASGDNRQLVHADWLTPPAAEGTQVQRVVVAVRVPTNPCGPLPAKTGAGDTHLTGPFVFSEDAAAGQLGASHVLAVEVEDRWHGSVVEHSEIPATAAALAAAVRKALADPPPDLDISPAAAAGHLYLATTLVGELAAMLGWQFAGQGSGDQINLRPLVWDRHRTASWSLRTSRWPSTSATEQLSTCAPAHLRTDALLPEAPRLRHYWVRSRFADTCSARLPCSPRLAGFAASTIARVGALTGGLG
ncbi:MAG: hypothetical protein ACOYEV_17325 [Candidatus Nanopelagicales bacterium]